MIELYGNRSNERYTYRRVSWPDFIEGGDLGNVTDGEVELSALSDLKAVCNFDYTGMESPDPGELVRIYYAFDDDNGEHADFPIGTFFIGYDETDYVADYAFYGNGMAFNGLLRSGSVDGWSTLKVLQDAKVGYPMTIPAGTAAVDRAVEIILSFGLRATTDASDYTLSSDHTFEATDSYLTVVNWLCSAAGFSSPYPDAFGTIHVERYTAPDSRSLVAVLGNGDNSIMYPRVVERNDWQSTPNVVRLSYDSDTLSLCAVAKNLSGSRASLASRGNREVTLAESVTELDGETSAEKLDNLKAKALSKLRDNSTEIEHVEVSHPYIPVSANDAIGIDYTDRAWRGTVQNMRIALRPSTKCDTEIRRFIESDIATYVTGEILYEGD